MDVAGLNSKFGSRKQDTDKSQNCCSNVVLLFAIQENE